VTRVYRISKRFAGIEAAHHLDGLPDGHKCSRLHGHSYAVEVTVTAQHLTGPGFVVDFAELAPLGDYLKKAADHRVLNEVFGFQPTSENLARHLYDWCQDNILLPSGARIESVRVSESATAWAEYQPDTAP
jgi:6-pyruvoyltetrahydropterin/6-carboxytetrahydropterin synthase